MSASEKIASACHREALSMLHITSAYYSPTLVLGWNNTKYRTQEHMQMRAPMKLTKSLKNHAETSIS